MLKTIKEQSYFIIRARTNTFKKQQEKMTTNDQTFEINLKNSQINKYHSEELKQYARKTKTLKVRIAKVALPNGITETLLTNLPPEKQTQKT